jgi:hypothetical protein
MRWTNPKPGTTRTITYFAFLPVFTREDADWRWLEMVTIKQEYEQATPVSSAIWRDIKFLDREKA